jgi:hypothetical protein
LKHQKEKPSVYTIKINPTVRSVEVVVYANTRKEEVHAKTVEVVVYANIRDKEVHAKTVEVVRYANTRE